MLYLVATPIGNLSDITLRALEVLKASDYILCEDTRHTLVLLNHYEIKKPLKSYHKFNESSQEQRIIDDLNAGQTVALVSDAGTPGISDPGAQLVQRCVAEGLLVTAIPGPCAAIMALSCSGFDTTRFQFFGFLPKKSAELRRTLQELLMYEGTTICYESPNRLLDVLKVIHELAPDRQLGVARELTKKFEESKKGTAEELLNYWKANPLKGEIVLLLSGAVNSVDWTTLTPQQHVSFLQQTYHLPQQEAIKLAAELRGVPKRDVYNTLHATQD